MDNSFNDQELADIMNEIESLESEIKAVEGKGEAKSSLKVSTPANEGISDEDMNDVLADLANLEEEAIPVQKASADEEVEEIEHDSDETQVINTIEENVVNMKPIKTEAPAHLSQSSVVFKVQGEMSIDLTFIVSGEEVHLQVTENGLVLGLQNGATFNLPIVSQNQKAKKAA